MSNSKIDDISVIIDYRIVNDGDHSKFIQKVNNYLKKGYTLHGFTKSIGPYLSQVIVKYSKPQSLIIEHYAVIGSGTWQSDKLEIERVIMDSLNDGWSLYGDHTYSKYTTDCPYTWQAMVKYKKHVILDDIDI